MSLALLVPGALIVCIRSRFLTGRRRSHTEEALSYAIVTLFYFAATLPLFHAIYTSDAPWWQRWALWVALILVIPALIGLALGVAYQKGWIARCLKRFGIDVIHPIPTAWDWKFGQRNEHWLIIRLKDGTVFHGYYGMGSFASSDGERDIYLEQIFDRDELGTWVPLPQGMWVQVSEVSTIEFLPVSR
ncbi:hypothetical protein FJ546_10295 [Mesorhizobium sp. B2-4-19]|nr:hypothetical protein FJ546_10295 [Mesorhizobium sp. B2-4-19]